MATGSGLGTKLNLAACLMCVYYVCTVCGQSFPCPLADRVWICLCVPHTSYLSVCSLTGEVVVKWFEAVQTELPMCALGGFGATFKLPQRHVTWTGTFLSNHIARCKFTVRRFGLEGLHQSLNNLPPLLLDYSTSSPFSFNHSMSLYRMWHTCHVT